MATWKIEQAELVEWLRAYEGPRFHAIVSDPPYALISIGKRFGKAASAPAQEGTDGRFSRLSGGFMGQKWDGFETLDHYREWVGTWAKLLIEKVLEPGAVCLFFGGTRTWHHLALGLEQGGFEVYDTIMWLHGQGFPKSHDVSKGLDKAAGAERTEVIGKRHRNVKPFDDTMGWNANETTGDHNYLAPVGDDAKAWDGYGTALKPAWEPILLCRAPRDGHTFAQLAIEHSSGALNIDGARISHNEPEEVMEPSEPKLGKTVYANARPSEDREGEELASPSPLGRWPANLILSHHEDCVRIEGDEPQKVKPRVINRFKSGMKPFGNAAGEEYETVADEDGYELVDRWACVPECAARQLDDQAGDRPSGPATFKVERGLQGRVFGAESREGMTKISPYVGETGGPSRFFYTSKAARAEKDLGLEDFYWKRVDTGFERVTKAEYDKLPRRERARGCIHPTVKPTAIIRYLATLVLPPKQEGIIRRILIPFSGSGSEVIGAIQAGWDEALGVEMEVKYNEMAEARLRASIGMF